MFERSKAQLSKNTNTSETLQVFPGRMGTCSCTYTCTLTLRGHTCVTLLKRHKTALASGTYLQLPCELTSELLLAPIMWCPRCMIVSSTVTPPDTTGQSQRGHKKHYSTHATAYTHVAKYPTYSNGKQGSVAV